MIVESFLVWLAHCLIRCLINLQLNKTLVLLDFLSFQFLPFKKWFCTGNWTMGWHAEAMTVSYPGPQTSSTLRWPFIQLLDLLRQHHHFLLFGLRQLLRVPERVSQIIQLLSVLQEEDLGGKTSANHQRLKTDCGHLLYLTLHNYLFLQLKWLYSYIYLYFLIWNRVCVFLVAHSAAGI